METLLIGAVVIGVFMLHSKAKPTAPPHPLSSLPGLGIPGFDQYGRSIEPMTEKMLSERRQHTIGNITLLNVQDVTRGLNSIYK